MSPSGFLRQKFSNYSSANTSLHEKAKTRLESLKAQKTKSLSTESLADFRSFCSLVEIRLKSGGQRSFAYDTWHEEQQRFERERSGLDIVLKPRQVGFSTLEIARDLWFAVTNRGVNVLVIAHDGELGQQLFLTLHIMAECLKAVGLLPKTRYSNKRELVFAETGSAVRIVEAGETDHAASKKGRSGTVHRLHATEVAFWGAAAETFGAVIQSVPIGGEVCIESTANGAGGTFYEDVQAAREGRSGYKLHFYAWYEHVAYRLPVPPDFDPAPRDEWERKLRSKRCDDGQITWWRSKVDDPKVGLEKALQEYPVDVDTCFRAAGRSYYAPGIIDSLSENIVQPSSSFDVVFNGRRLGAAQIWAEPVRDVAYVIGADIAEGIGGDASSAHVLEHRTGVTVATFWSDSLEPGDFGLAMAVLGWRYNTALLAPERNNHGHSTIRAIVTEARYQRVYVASDRKHGWHTNPATRPPLFDELHHACELGAATTPDASTVKELRTLIVDDDGKPRARNKGAKDGCHDDRAVSWAIAWQIRSRTNTEPGRVQRMPGRYS